MNLIKRIQEFDYNEHYYLFLIIGFCISLRVLTPQIIGAGGGDAVESWGMARCLYFNADYFIIHRTARFGTIIPIYLTQLLFGTHPLVYYIAPAIASVIQIIFFFKIADILRGRIFAFVSSLIFLSFPQMIRDVSHPRVSVFSSMFFLISLYFALKFYMDCMDCTEEKTTDGPELKDLFISGFNVFLMYMAKEDSLYFLPALLLIIFISRKKFSDVVLFGILPFSLFLSETLFYYLFTDFKMGRLSVVTAKEHFDTITPICLWYSLFDRFRGENLRPYFRYPLIFSFIGGVYICLKHRYILNKRINPAVFIIISLFIYVLLMTFLVKSIHPLIPLNTFRTRYMNIIIPPMILIIMYTIFELNAAWKKPEFFMNLRKIFPSSLSSYKKLFLLFFVIIYTIITAYTFFIVYKKSSYKGREISYAELHPFHLVNNYYRIINRQYNSGKPFIIREVKEEGKRFADFVKTIDDWIDSGMTVEQACKKCSITDKLYLSYQEKAEETITYPAEDYLTPIFLHPDNNISGLAHFALILRGKVYRFYYNSRLTDMKKIIREIKSGETVYPEIVDSPLEIIFTDVAE